MIVDITIYPVEDALHSSSGDLSALAGYAKALFRAFPPEVRRQHVVLSNVKAGGPRVYDDDGLQVRECWRKGSLLFAWDIWKQFRANPDWRVAHLQHEFNQFGGMLTLLFMLFLLAALRFCLSRKIAITLHEVLSPELIDKAFLQRACIPYPPPLVRRGFFIYYRLLGYLAHALVVQDEHFANILTRDYGITALIDIVRLGTDEAEAMPRALARKEMQIKEDSFVLLFFGSLDWRKGLDVLIAAYSLLPRGKFVLLIGGAAPRRVVHTAQYQEWWAKILQSLDGLDDVHQLGFVADEDIPCIFGAVDLVVFPYLFPQRISAAFNQAVSFGVPCIVSEAFASQADPEIIFETTPQKLAEKILWAAEGNMPQLKDYALAFRAANSWKFSAEAMMRIHERLTTGTR